MPSNVLAIEPAYTIEYLTETKMIRFKVNGKVDKRCKAFKNNIVDVDCNLISDTTAEMVRGGERKVAKNPKNPKKTKNSKKTKNPKKTKKQVTNDKNDVIWSDISKKTLITEHDHFKYQEVAGKKLEIHNSEDIDGVKGRPLWFTNSEEASSTIITLLIDKNTSNEWISLVAEPGSGKTMVIHNLIYQISLLSYENFIPTSNITLTTGMSDNDWGNQVIKNLKIKDGDFLWKEVNNLNENFCITHRSNFSKRINYLIQNINLLYKHIFIIDESHFADETDMTMDKEFQKIGLTEELMIQYEIRIIFVSATPDVNLSIFNRKENHKIVQLENGEDYKGFKFYFDEQIINPYDSDLEKIIKKNWTTPRFHFIRVRVSQGSKKNQKNEERKDIESFCKNNDWVLIEDDSSNDYYLSFRDDIHEKNADEKGENNIVKLYKEPNKHTIILLKNKYTASKRLELTSFTGLISEKTSQKRDTSNTCNGLIPRFFGYRKEPIYKNDERPIMHCDINSVKEYINFSKDFIYDGKDYTGKKIKSSKTKTKEIKNTCYGEIGNSVNQKTDSEIDIKSFSSLPEIVKNLKSLKLFENIRDITFDKQDRNGYKFPKRNVPGHDIKESADTFLTEKSYKKIGVGNNINRQGKEGTGQSFMIYPVYPDSNSKPEDVKYYLHYLKDSNNED